MTQCCDTPLSDSENDEQVKDTKNKMSPNSTSSSHSLDPLSVAEILCARDTMISHMCDTHDVTKPRFSFISLHEESCMNDVRVAEAVVQHPPSVARLLRVQFNENKKVCSVISDHELEESVQPVLTPDDCTLAESIALEDKTLMNVLEKSYGFDIADIPKYLVCDPWSVHMADNPIPEAYQNDDDIDDDVDEIGVPRLVQLFLYYKFGVPKDGSVQLDEWNHYAHPLHFVPIVDLARKKIVAIHGVTTSNLDQLPKLSIPQHVMNYFPSTMKFNTQLIPATQIDRGLKPIDIIQPQGHSFSLNGTLLKWDQWTLRIGFNHREGVVLRDIHFNDRSIVRRISLAEMAVPYGDPHAPYHRKCAFDVGDYGLGYCANSLQLGCDCVGDITYMNATLASADGSPYVIENAICIHEEDAGTLQKHMEYRTGKAYVRRARKLIISFVATVVNYEYLFYFYLHVDGSLGLDIKLSGMLSTNVLSHDEVDTNNGMPTHGTLVGPEVNAQIHQHMFCARIEPAIDGELNRISELNPISSSNNASFNITETPLRTEKSACRESALGRSWRISNHTVPFNPISKKAVAYRLFQQPPCLPLLTKRDSVVSKRARFAERALHVTKRRESDRYPAGEYPTQDNGLTEEGVSKFGSNDASIEDQSLTCWLSFGILHSPRTEDFPIMPCETVGFVMKPDSFFNGNPTIDMMKVESKTSVCYHANGSSSSSSSSNTNGK